MKRLTFAIAALLLAACSRPDAIFYADFEDDVIGALPSTMPAGAPDDRIGLGNLVSDPAQTQVIVAPPMALDDSSVAMSIDDANTKALSLNPSDRIGGPSNSFRTVGVAFQSETIPVAMRDETYTVTLTGVKDIDSASFTLRNAGLSRFATIRVFENEILLASNASPLMSFAVPQGTNGRFSLRFSVDPTTLETTITWRTPTDTYSGTLNHEPSMVLNRLSLTPLVQNSSRDGRAVTDALVVDNIQMTPPLDIRITGIGS
ncbi:MAG: hypothetical protein AAGH70_12250 [Pseudomonadota bacterium]